MVIYRLEARIIGRKGTSAPAAAAYRSGGRVSETIQRSAVACAAYRHQARLTDHAAGRTHDYTQKRHVEHSEILAPEGAPEWVLDRERLWNRVERAEDSSTRRATAQLARELLLTIPRGLSAEQRVALVRGFVREQCVARGMVADVALHNPDAGDGGAQPHAHVMLTTRRLAGEGFDSRKARDWNDVAFLKHPEHGQLAKAREGGLLHAWRQAWQDHVNRALADTGSSARVDHRSLKDRNIDRAPQPKLGIARHARNEIPHLVRRRQAYALVNHDNVMRAMARAMAKRQLGHRLPVALHAAGPPLEIEPAQRRRRGHAPDRGGGIDR